MKGNVRIIGGALVVGITVILGALFVKGDGANSQAGSVVVSQAPTREYIASNDADGDGIKDWEESLAGLITDTIEIASGTSSYPESDEPYTPPTTFTGKFSEALFQDYMQGKISGADMSDPTELVSKAVTAIDTNTQSVRHTRAELNIIPSTPESLRAYGNELAGILKKHSINNEHELIIFSNALEKNDPALLTELTPIRDVYTHTTADILTMNVPDSVTSAHINLLNAAEALRTDLDAMLIVFDDPLYALARVRGYEKNAQALFNAFAGYLPLFDSAGLTFTSNEPGAFFYVFEK